MKRFLKNFFFLIGANTITNLISFISMFFIAKFYSPKDFGIYSTFISFSSFLSVFATGKYELAIIIPKNLSHSSMIFFIGCLLNITFHLLIFLIIFLLKIFNLFSFLENEYIKFVPIGSFFVACFNLLIYFCNRLEYYNIIAKSYFFKTITMVLIQNIGIFFQPNYIYLILSFVFSYIIATVYLYSIIGSKLYFSFKKDILKLKILAKKYSKFIKYKTFQTIIGKLSNDMIIIITSYCFSYQEAGFVSMVYRLLGTPMGLVSQSLGFIFYKSLAQRYIIDKTTLVNYYLLTLKRLILFMVFVSLLLSLIINFVVNTFLKEKWEPIIEFSEILFPIFFLGSIGSVLSYVVNLFQKQDIALLLEIIMFLLRGLSLLIGVIYENIYIGLILVTLTSSSLTIYRIYWYYRIIKEVK